MQEPGASLLLSASDLVGHLHCRRLTALDVEVANGTLEKPKTWDPFQEILQKRGRRREEGTIEHLKGNGLAVTVVEGVGVHKETLARTREAMKAGADVIIQAAFRSGGWVGRTGRAAAAVSGGVATRQKSSGRRLSTGQSSGRVVIRQHGVYGVN